jgi:hypothetical protein
MKSKRSGNVGKITRLGGGTGTRGLEEETDIREFLLLLLLTCPLSSPVKVLDLSSSSSVASFTSTSTSFSLLP